MPNINFTLTGIVKEIGSLVHMKKKTGPDLRKKVITVETVDGQVLYLDIINTRLKVLESEKIEVGSVVGVEYSFKGSERDGKKYNNIYCNGIVKM